MLQVPFDGLAGPEAESSAPKGVGPFMSLKQSHLSWRVAGNRLGLFLVQLSLDE